MVAGIEAIHPVSADRVCRYKRRPRHFWRGTEESKAKRGEPAAPRNFSRRNARLVLGRLAQHVATAPHRLNVVLAARGVGELLAQLADEDVDDLELGLVHAAVKVIEEHLFGE